MTGIYKITNTINNHAYIGLAVNITDRWAQHRNPYNHDREDTKVLYKAFEKYGIENFNFEVLEECSPEMLGAREKYWIAYYDTFYNGYNMTAGGETHIGDSHPRHKLTEKDVIAIRTRYNNKERKKEVFEDYRDRIGESGFAKIWKGESWKHVMPEVYTQENKEFHLHNTGNTGSENGRARLTETDVKNIRIRRKNGELLSEVYQDYKDKLTKGSFSNVWTYQNWKNIVV